MKTILECVPNFSEGRDLAIIEKLVDPFRGKSGVRLLDYQRDHDHNRSVVTVVGEPEALKPAVLAAMIDMRRHRGQHPRMGAVDVVPFVPIKNITMAQAVEFSNQFAKAAAEQLKVPIFMYEASATRTERRNLADIRKGQFENMAAKLKDPDWAPDYGPQAVHPTAGVTAVGARMSLIAYNVNLDTDRLEIAEAIARKVRYIGGGLRYCKAMGVALEARGMVQVSMNMTDYSRTALYRAFELIRIEARRYGVNVAGSEIVGLVPMAALTDAAAYYLGLENFSIDQVLEHRIYE
jgi:glutamate formiminotransferase